VVVMMMMMMIVMIEMTIVMSDEDANQRGCLGHSITSNVTTYGWICDF
jgi:hypothetical protein